jgi:hypothetical protein
MRRTRKAVATALATSLGCLVAIALLLWRAPCPGSVSLLEDCGASGNILVQRGFQVQCRSVIDAVRGAQVTRRQSLSLKHEHRDVHNAHQEWCDTWCNVGERERDEGHADCSSCVQPSFPVYMAQVKASERLADSGWGIHIPTDEELRDMKAYRDPAAKQLAAHQQQHELKVLKQSTHQQMAAAAAASALPAYVQRAQADVASKRGSASAMQTHAAPSQGSHAKQPSKTKARAHSNNPNSKDKARRSSARRTAGAAQAAARSVEQGWARKKIQQENTDKISDFHLVRFAQRPRQALSNLHEVRKQTAAHSLSSTRSARSCSACSSLVAQTAS